MKTLFQGQSMSVVLDDDTKTYQVYGSFLPNEIVYTSDVRVLVKDNEITNIIDTIKKEYKED